VYPCIQRSAHQLVGGARSEARSESLAKYFQLPQKPSKIFPSFPITGPLPPTDEHLPVTRCDLMFSAVLRQAARKATPSTGISITFKVLAFSLELEQLQKTKNGPVGASKEEDAML
jgi:hypothetical protein